MFLSLFCFRNCSQNLAPSEKMPSIMTVQGALWAQPRSSLSGEQMLCVPWSSITTCRWTADPCRSSWWVLTLGHRPSLTDQVVVAVSDNGESSDVFNNRNVLFENVCSMNHYCTPCFNEVERGVYWFHVVCPSVDIIVSLFIFHNTCWIHFIFTHLIKQLQKVCWV